MTEKEFLTLSIDDKWKLYLNNGLPFAKMYAYCVENYVSLASIKQALK